MNNYTMMGCHISKIVPIMHQISTRDIETCCQNK